MFLLDHYCRVGDAAKMHPRKFSSLNPKPEFPNPKCLIDLKVYVLLSFFFSLLPKRTVM